MALPSEKKQDPIKILMGTAKELAKKPTVKESPIKKKVIKGKIIKEKKSTLMKRNPPIKRSRSLFEELKQSFPPHNEAMEKNIYFHLS